MLSGYCNCSPATGAAACCAQNSCNCSLRTLNFPTMALGTISPMTHKGIARTALPLLQHL